MLQKQIIYVTGLPRSGATLLCHLLSQHPEIEAAKYESPLCPTLISLRHQLRDDPVLLPQFDQQFDPTYERLIQAFQGFTNGWFAAAELPWVIDRNADWLRHLEMLQCLDPNWLSFPTLPVGNKG